MEVIFQQLRWRSIVLTLVGSGLQAIIDNYDSQ